MEVWALKRKKNEIQKNIKVKLGFEVFFTNGSFILKPKFDFFKLFGDNLIKILSTFQLLEVRSIWEKRELLNYYFKKSHKFSVLFFGKETLERFLFFFLSLFF